MGDLPTAPADVLTFLSGPRVLASKRWTPAGALDYDAGAGPYRVLRASVNSLPELAQVLRACPGNAFHIRGAPLDPNAQEVPWRLVHTNDGRPPTFEPEPHRAIPVDWDGDADPAHDPLDVLAAATLVRSLLPEEFHTAACIAHATSSAGIKPGLRLRLWFWADRPVGDKELKSILKPHVRDLSIYTAVQPIYVAPPTFDGVLDPFATRTRWAYVQGTPEVAIGPARFAHADLLTPAAPATHGGRNVHLASMAGAMRRKGFEAPAILAALLEHNATLPAPLAQEEVERIAKSIANYEAEGVPVVLAPNPERAEKTLRRQRKRLAQDPSLLPDAAARIATYVREGSLTEAQAVAELARGIADCEIAHAVPRDAIATAIRTAPEAPAPEGPQWAESGIYTDEGKLLPCPENLRIVLAHHPEIALWWDSRAQRDMWDKCPWHPAGPVLPTDDFALRAWLSRELGWHKCPAEPLAAVAEVSRARSFDPWRGWLDAAVWDGTERLLDAAPALLGCDATPANRATFAWWMLSAAARSLQPGAQVDHMIVLEGPQGLGKTSFFRALALAPEFFTRLTHVIDASNPRVVGKIHGPVIVELAELESLRKSDVEAVKAFIDERFDRVQWLYSRKPVDIGRTCVFAGTSNGSTYLRDITGNRRFWPIACGRIDLTLTAEIAPQLWAEAVHLIRAGEKWWPTAEESEALGLREIQDARRESEPAEESLSAALDTKRAPGRHPITGAMVAPEQLDALGRYREITVEQAAEMLNMHAVKDGRALTRALQVLGWVKVGRTRYVHPERERAKEQCRNTPMS